MDDLDLVLDVMADILAIMKNQGDEFKSLSKKGSSK